MPDATNWKAVTPENKRKVSPLVRHYMKQAHPFTACVNDNAKRFGKDRAERICAVVKDLGERSTKWRKGKKLQESAFDADMFVEEVFDTEWAPVLDAEGVTVDELAAWSIMATDAGLLESPLELTVELGLLEATMSGRQAQAREGRRQMRGDQRKDGGKETAQTRSGGNADFEKEHPRTRGGEWTLKAGAKGDDVRAVQRRVGAKADGDFGAQTRQKIMDFQRKHGLSVDGVVGRQTVAAMRGDVDADALKPGEMTEADRKWLRTRQKKADDHRRVRESAVTGPLAMPVDVGAALRETAQTDPLALVVGEDLRLAETDDGAIRESFDLAVVDGHGMLSLVESAVTPDALFNADGTIDFVIIRPSNGRGVGSRIYEADMLRENAHVFTGWPVYDNHDSPEAARARRGIPRPPSELAGEIRESFWDGDFTTPDDAKMDFGPGAVIGRFMLTEDMERLVRRLPRAVKTSINAQATSMRVGVRNGKRGMLVEGIADDPENSSVDLVTKAGAGGQVAALYRQLAAA